MNEDANPAVTSMFDNVYAHEHSLVAADRAEFADYYASLGAGESTEAN